MHYDLYQDRARLKNHVGEIITACSAVVISTSTDTRLHHQVTLVSVQTPYGKLDHLTVNLNPDQLGNIARFYPIKFKGKVNRYQHEINGHLETTYGIKDLFDVHTTNYLPDDQLSSYQRRSCSRFNINPKTLARMPNNGQRENYIYRVSQGSVNPSLNQNQRQSQIDMTSQASQITNSTNSSAPASSAVLSN